MKPLYLALALGAVCAPVVSAQTFHQATSITPVPGSTQVATQAHITFTFSKPLTEGLDWETVSEHVGVYPETAIEILGFTQSEDRTAFTVTAAHQANTTYHWVISGIESADGSLQFRTRTTTYHTGFMMGGGQVTGQLSDARMAAKTASTASVPMFPTLWDNTTVMLVRDADFLDEFDEVTEVVGVAVPGSNGTFTIDHLDAGTYYAFAIGSTWNDSYIAWGWYDADGDGAPDAFEVGASPVGGIDFTLHDFSEFMMPVTSGHSMGRTIDQFEALHADATLRYAMGMELLGFPQNSLTGSSMFWNYTAYSPSANVALEAVATRFASEVNTLAPDEVWVDPTDLQVIPESAISSDAAANIAMNEGARVFLEHLPMGHFTIVTYSLGLPAETDEGPIELPEVPYWFVHVQSTWVEGDQPRFESFHIAIHAVTGEVLTKFSTSAEDRNPVVEAEFRLEGNYPNPFNPTTVIRYQLTVDSKTRLSVYDLLGREVAVLVDGMMPAGEHAATFDAAGLSSGVYLYRLTSGNQVLTRTMTLVK